MCNRAAERPGAKSQSELFVRWRLHENLHYKEVQGAEQAEWAWFPTVRGSIAFSFSLRPAAAENWETKAGHLDPTVCPDKVSAPIIRLRRIRHKLGSSIST
jgi:hypothetical protein